VGVQFHPESILTQMGYRLLASFLIRAGITIVEHVPPWHDEQRDVAAEPVPLPDRPLTF